jgi:hypothetical protein
MQNGNERQVISSTAIGENFLIMITHTLAIIRFVIIMNDECLIYWLLKTSQSQVLKVIYGTIRKFYQKENKVLWF